MNKNPSVAASALSILQREETRREFTELTNQGRKWCYHLMAAKRMGAYVIGIVVENHPEIFETDWTCGSVESNARIHVINLNRNSLQIDDDEVQRITLSSLTAAM